MSLPVVFRVFRTDGQVIAVFPTVPASASGLLMLSYMTVAEFGGVDWPEVLALTRPAGLYRYRPLLARLKKRGYSEVRIITRVVVRHHKARFKAAVEVAEQPAV